MFTPIHRVLGLEAGELSLDLIKQAVEHGVEESGDLDWKKAVYDRRNQKSGDEAAKDIAAMANSGGGWIVFGVSEDGEKNAAKAISPVDWSGDIEQRILRIAYARIGPPVVGLEFFAIPCDEEESEGYVVVMRVPDSSDAPHFARKGDDSFTAPRRNGPHTVFMSDREIERGFRERFQRAEDQEQILQNYFERASLALNPQQGVFLAIAAVPVEAKTAMPPPDRHDVLQHTSQNLLPELLQSSTCSDWWGASQVKKGMRQWVVRNSPDGEIRFRKFLYDDATVLGSYQLGLLINDDESRPYYPVGLPNQCLPEDIELALVDFISLFRSHAQERGANSDFYVRAGLVGDSEQPILIRERNSATRRMYREQEAEPIIHSQPVTTTIDPLAPISEILPVANDLALDLINQGGVNCLKYMAKP